MTPLLRPLTPTSDAPDLSVFEPLVKNYYHAKFRASSSKIDQVIGLVRVSDTIVYIYYYISKWLYSPNSWAKAQSAEFGQLIAIPLARRYWDFS